MAPEMLLMSKVVFDKLPKAEQDMIRAAAKESVAFQRKKWDEQEAKSLAVGEGRRRRRSSTSTRPRSRPRWRRCTTSSSPRRTCKRLVKAIQDTK